VGGVDFVPPVDVPGAQEPVFSPCNQSGLVGRGVSTETTVAVDVVGVGGGTRDVIGRDKKVVETVLGLNNWRKGIVDRKGTCVGGIKVVLYRLLDCVQRMVRL